jgi:hypothetical protein
MGGSHVGAHRANGSSRGRIPTGRFLAGYAGARRFRGDHKADVAIDRKATGEWFVFGTVTGYSTLLVGSPASLGLGDIPVPADDDGDGKGGGANGNTSRTG